MTTHIGNLPLDLQTIIMDKKIQLEIDSEYKSRMFDYGKSTIPELKNGILLKFKEFCDEDFIALHFSHLHHKSDYIRVAEKIKAPIYPTKTNDKMKIKIRIQNEKLFKYLNKNK